MDISNLKRAPDVIHRNWVNQKGGQIVTKVPCKVLFPKHYLDSQLGSVDERFNTIAIFAVVMGDSYGVSSALAVMPFTPDETNVVTIDGTPYAELSWEAGSVVCPNRNLVVNDKMAYAVYDEIVAKGKTPWYLTPVDLGTLFDSSVKHAGANLHSAPAILQIFTASRVRIPGDRSRYAREVYKTQDDLINMPTDVIPLRSVSYGATNTTARLTGAYLSEGINSSLLNPAKQTEEIEELLRK